MSCWDMVGTWKLLYERNGRYNLQKNGTHEWGFKGFNSQFCKSGAVMGFLNST